MRRPGYLIAVLVLGALAVGAWFLLFSRLPDEPPRESPAEVETAPAEIPEEPTVEVPASELEPASAQGPVETDLELIECILDVERWDTGDRATVERKYGENAEAVVEGCRAVVPPATD